MRRIDYLSCITKIGGLGGNRSASKEGMEVYEDREYQGYRGG